MSSSDPKGYYECLGVQSNADAETIKSAYRALAKKYHPDVNRDPAAKAIFQKINAAHGILSDPEARNAYDSLRYSKPAAEPEQEKLNPIACSHCGKVTAQPRATVFFRVVSYLLVTTKTPIQGIFCSDCATKLGLRASLISALFGWWGFPWGPIWTISSICTNAMGGKQSQDLTERLTWYNAVAFLSQGKLALAHALAEQSRKASDLEISLKAAKLIEYLRSRGVPAETPTLKNPRSNRWVAIAHIALLLALPGAVGVAIAYDDLTRPSYSPSYSFNPPPVSHPAPKTDFSKYGTPVSTPVQTCSRPPINGQVLVRNIGVQEYAHKIKVENGTAGNAIIKLRDASSGVLRLSFFVERGRTASFDELPDGNYRIQYAFGDLFDFNCRSFAKIESASQIPTIRSFRAEQIGDQVRLGSYSFTLYTVPGGNLRPQSIDVSTFNAN